MTLETQTCVRLAKISLVLVNVSNPLVIHRPPLGTAQCVGRARATIAGQTKNGKKPRIQPLGAVFRDLVVRLLAGLGEWNEPK